MQENSESDSPQKRTKVCLVVTKGEPYGGAQKYVYTIATSLPKDRFDVFVICGRGNTLKEKLRAAGIRVYDNDKMKRDFNMFSAVSIGLGMLKILRAEKPDVVHLNSAKASGVGAVAGRLAGVRHIIYTVHGFAFNEDRGDVYQLLTGFFSWLTIMLCHNVIVINEKELRQVAEMPFTKKKAVLVRNGIEHIEFLEKDIAREKLLAKITEKISGKATWFGTIAELHKNKGLEYAIIALSKVNSPFVFCIIGEGEERKNLEELIAKYDLRQKVFLIGAIDGAKVFLHAFDIFLLTSVKEGLPYVLLEAGFAGLPVIASRVGGIPDVIDDNESGILVTKARDGEITRSIEFLLENPDKAKLFAENLKQKVEKNFSFEQMLEKTIAVYEK